MAAVGLLITGSGTAWADTEQLDGSAKSSKDNAIALTSIQLEASNNRGYADVLYNSAKTIKLGCTQTIDGQTNCIKFTVLNNHTVNAIKGFGRANFDGTITWKAVYVDDDFETNLLPYPIVFSGSTKEPTTFSSSNYGKYVAMPFNLVGLNASKNIYIITDGGELTSGSTDSNNGQLYFGATVTYDLKFPTIPADVTTTPVKISWTFNEGTGDKAVVTTDNGDAFSSAIVALGSNLSYSGTDSKLGTTTTTITASAAGTASANDVTFTINPWSGITFVPTKVYFQAKKHGTSDDLISTTGYLSYYVSSGSTKETLGENLNPTRNSNTTVSKICNTVPSAFASDVTKITATKDNPFNLAITLLQAKSYSFANIVIEGYYYGTAVKNELYTVSTSVTPEGAGKVNITNQEYEKGTTVELTATANTGYKFVRWTENGSEVTTEATYTIESLESNRDFVAEFEALKSITYAAESGVKGTVPSKAYYEANSVITLPANNFTLYKEGYTQTGWNDGTSDYAMGDQYTVKDNTTLTAVFSKNEKTLAELVTESHSDPIVINWSFDHINNPAPSIGVENNTGMYVLPAKINGTTIDLKMDIDASKGAVTANQYGKLNNITTDGTYAQANANTKMTIPVAVNGIINVKAAKGTLKTSTINDKATSSYTCTEDGDAVIIIRDANIYLSGITLTFQPNTVTLSSINAATLCLPLAVKIPEEGIKAYTGELNDNTLTLTQVEGVIPAGEAVILVGDAGSYKFEVSSEAGTKATKNDLVGNSTSSEITPSVKDATVCVLDKVNNELGFYKWTGKIPAYKAYLAVPNATTEETSSSAPEIRVVFNDEPGNVTAIESIAAEAGENAPIYTLSGRQVKGIAAPGLYIQGGKKILVK
jgi:hypothetical protein